MKRVAALLSIAEMQLMLLGGLSVHAAHPTPSSSTVKAEIIAASPGWACPTAADSLRVFERRARVAFLSQQRPREIFVHGPSEALPPRGPGQRVRDELQLAAWLRWDAPVTVEVLIPTRVTSPPEAAWTDPNGYLEPTVAKSSGVDHVDSAAMIAVLTCGGFGLEQCSRNAWRIQATFYPPAVANDGIASELLLSLEDSDPWVRVLAATELLAIGAHEDQARGILRQAVSDRDERISGLAKGILKKHHR